MLAEGPLVQWGTWDGSPQAGWDWRMHGRIRMCVSDRACLFHKAVKHIDLNIEWREAEEQWLALDGNEVLLRQWR